MIKSYFINLYHAFCNVWWITLPILLIFIIAFIFICMLGLMFIMDATYRPNISQYPYNLILDKIIPIVLICSPTIIMLKLNPNNFSLIEKCIAIILIHFFVLIPIMYIWSRNRNWSYNAIQYWHSPSLMFNILIVLTYLALFVLLLSCIRFLRLGQDIYFDYTYLINFFKDPIIFTLFFSPFTLGWCLILISKIIDFRNLMWMNVVSLFHSLHVKFLKYHPYFILMEFIYKFCFICYTFIIKESIIYNKRPLNRIRFYIHYLYINSYLFSIIMFLIIIFELYFRNYHLYFSLYILFLFIIIKNVFYFINNFACSNWAFDCCVADYVTFNIAKPKYKNYFWYIFSTIHEDLKLNYNDYFIEKKIEEKIEKNKKYIKMYKLTSKKILNNLIKNPLMPYANRVKISYYQWSNVRWTHTSCRGVYHPLTGLFARTLSEKIVLVNDNWQVAYAMIQKNEKLYPKNVEHNSNPFRNKYFYPFTDIEKVHQTGLLNIAKVSELGALSWFTPIANKVKALVSPYKKNILLQTKSQAEPGVIPVDPKTFKESPEKTAYVQETGLTANLINNSDKNSVLNINNKKLSTLLPKLDTPLDNGF